MARRLSAILDNSGALQSVPDPVDSNSQNADVDEAIREAGYTIRVCRSQTQGAYGAEIAIYQTEQPDRPRYYLELMGSDQSIASLVADSFPELVDTLQKVQPLVALIGLDQRAQIQAEEVSARDQG